MPGQLELCLRIENTAMSYPKERCFRALLLTAQLRGAGNWSSVLTFWFFSMLQAKRTAVGCFLPLSSLCLIFFVDYLTHKPGKPEDQCRDLASLEQIRTYEPQAVCQYLFFCVFMWSGVDGCKNSEEEWE